MLVLECFSVGVMSNQTRTVKRATCVVLSVFVILCAITDKVDCQRGFSFGRIGSRPGGRPGGTGRTSGSFGTVYRPAFDHGTPRMNEPPIPSVANYEPAGFDFVRPGEYRPVLRPTPYELIGPEFIHLGSHRDGASRPSVTSTNNFDFQSDFNHVRRSERRLPVKVLSSADIARIRFENSPLSRSSSWSPVKSTNNYDLEPFEPKSKHSGSSGHSTSQSSVKRTNNFDWEPEVEHFESSGVSVRRDPKKVVSDGVDFEPEIEHFRSSSLSNRRHPKKVDSDDIDLEHVEPKSKHLESSSHSASHSPVKSSEKIDWERLEDALEQFESFLDSTDQPTVKSTNNFDFEPKVKHSESFSNSTNQPSMNNTQKFVTSSLPHSSTSAPSLEHVNNRLPTSGLELLGSPKHSKQTRNAPLYEGAASTKATTPPPENITNNQLHGNASTVSSRPLPYVLKDPVDYPANVQPINSPPPGAPFLIHPPPYMPHSPEISPSASNSSHNPAGYGPPPAYSPTGYGLPSAHGAHSGGYGDPNHLHIAQPGNAVNNIVTNNHTGSGELGYNPRSYHYSSDDVGSDILGLFLGYSLAKVTAPTYHYHSSFYDGYTPRYDHYEVHHYYHKRESVPAQSTIQPSAIVGCVGDSGTICPNGTTSLCTNNGAILCVASATNTVPCTDGKQGNCVKAVIPCVNGTGNCEVGMNTTITIPCISTATVPGNITYVNNTIIANQTFTINNNKSTSGNGTITTTNSTMHASSNLIENGSVPLTKNLTQSSAWSTLGNLTDSTTGMPTTPPPTTEGTINKREAPAEPVNNFCVAILALPAKRKPSEQEEIVKKGTSMFTKFLVRTLVDS